LLSNDTDLQTSDGDVLLVDVGVNCSTNCG